MATTIHKNLTGADLHEPKGVAAATLGQVYVSDGVGSGVWTTVANLVTAGGFSTGDTKLTYKTTADIGWILNNTLGTIGDGSSSATVRANADTIDLFKLLYNTCNNSLCPVSGGRGASAAADYAAHKTIQLPDVYQRVLGVAGAYNGAGQTTRSVGEFTGTETHTLTAAQIPQINSNGSAQVSGPGGLNFALAASVVDTSVTLGGAGQHIPQSSGSNWTGTASINGTASVASNNTLGQSHNNMQPTAFLNMMIKL